MDLVAYLQLGGTHRHRRSCGYIVNRAARNHVAGVAGGIVGSHNGGAADGFHGHPAAEAAAGVTQGAIILVNSGDHIAAGLQGHSYIRIQLVHQSLILGLVGLGLSTHSQLDVIVAVCCGGTLGGLGGRIVAAIQIPVDLAVDITTNHVDMVDIALHIAQTVNTVAHLQLGNLALGGCHVGHIVDLAAGRQHTGVGFTVTLCGYSTVSSDLGHVGIVEDGAVCTLYRAGCIGSSNDIAVQFQTQNLCATGINGLHNAGILGLQAYGLAVDGHFEMIEAVSGHGAGRFLLGGIVLTLHIIIQFQIPGTVDHEDDAYITVGVGQTVDLVAQTQFGGFTQVCAGTGHIIDLAVVGIAQSSGLALVAAGKLLRIEAVCHQVDIIGLTHLVQTLDMIPAGSGRATGGKLGMFDTNDNALFVKFQGHTFCGKSVDLIHQAGILGFMDHRLTIHNELDLIVAAGGTGTGAILGIAVVLTVCIPVDRLRLKGRHHEDVAHIAIQTHNGIDLVTGLQVAGNTCQQTVIGYVVNAGVLVDLQLQRQTSAVGDVVTDHLLAFDGNYIVFIGSHTAGEFMGLVNAGDHVVLIHGQTHEFIGVDQVHGPGVFYEQVHLLTVNGEADTVGIAGFATEGGLDVFIIVQLSLYVPVKLDLVVALGLGFFAATATEYQQQAQKQS